MQIGQDPKPVMRDTYNMFKGGGDPEKFIRLESRKTSHFCASPDIFSCGGVGCGDGGRSGGFGGGGGSGGGGGGVAVAVAVEVVNVVVQVVELDVEVEEDMEFSSFSSGTERAVKTWQASLDAPQDGIISELNLSSGIEVLESLIGSTLSSDITFEKISSSTYRVRINSSEKKVEESRSDTKDSGAVDDDLSDDDSGCNSGNSKLKS
ncbi:unnamed protein product [Prunus armeniaca]